MQKEGSDERTVPCWEKQVGDSFLPALRLLRPKLLSHRIRVTESIKSERTNYRALMFLKQRY